MKYEKILLNGRNSLLVTAIENIGQNAMPVLVFWQPFMVHEGLRPPFHPLKDGLNHRGVVTQPTATLLLLEAPI